MFPGGVAADMVGDVPACSPPTFSSGCCGLAAALVPHEVQNAAPGLSGAPQAVQNLVVSFWISNFAPQALQYFAPSFISAPHCAHFIFIPLLFNRQNRTSNICYSFLTLATINIWLKVRQPAMSFSNSLLKLLRLTRPNRSLSATPLICSIRFAQVEPPYMRSRQSGD